MALVFEYLRRMALWADALQLADSGPFFDLAIRVSPATTLPSLSTALDAIGTAHNPLHRAICGWYLHWTVIADLTVVRRVSLPAPYEPLIRLYERNGSFRRADVFIDVGVVGIPVSRWRSYAQRPPLRDLDDTTLDALDRSAPGDAGQDSIYGCKQRRMGKIAIVAVRWIRQPTTTSWM